MHEHDQPSGSANALPPEPRLRQRLPSAGSCSHGFSVTAPHRAADNDDFAAGHRAHSRYRFADPIKNVTGTQNSSLR